MATVSLTTTCTDNPKLFGSVTLNVTEGSQSIVNNTTTLNWSIQAIQNINKDWGFAGATRPNAGYIDIKIDGTTVRTVSWPAKNASYDSQPTTNASGSYTVTHDLNGNKSVSIQVVVRRGTPPSGYTGYLWEAASSNRKTMTLTTIQRKATLTSAPNFNDEENPTITYSNPAGNAVTSLRCCLSFNGSTDDINFRDLSKTGSSFTFNLTDEERIKLRQWCNNSGRKPIKFILETVIEGVNYYSVLTKQLSITNCFPDAYVTFKDTNTVTRALTGNDRTVVIGYSNMQYSVTYHLKKYATLRSFNIFIQGYENKTSLTGTFIGVKNGYYEWMLYDSRGNGHGGTSTLPTVNYSKPVVNLTPTNLVVSDNKIRVNVSGTFSNISFGAVTNALTCKLYFKENTSSVWTETSFTPTISGNNFSYETEYTGLNYRKVYNIKVAIEDKLESIEKSVEIVSNPIFDWGKEDFNFNVPVSCQKDLNCYGHTAILGTIGFTGPITGDILFNDTVTVNKINITTNESAALSVGSGLSKLGWVENVAKKSGNVVNIVYGMTGNMVPFSIIGYVPDGYTPTSEISLVARGGNDYACNVAISTDGEIKYVGGHGTFNSNINFNTTYII